jgi:2-polyprenyl-3-methyl-5-hydroxy-6-metoxy-1,4-benzoquinol methylase
MACNLCKNKQHKIIFTKNKYDIHKCQVCGFVFVHPLPELHILEKYYKTSYEKGAYKLYADAEDIRLKINEWRFAEIAPYLNNGNILDVGCGVGYFLNVASKNNLSTYGTEFSEQAVKKAKENHKNIYKGSLEEANFPDSFFDNVTIFDVIEHVMDPTGTMKEIGRIIKKGGILSLTTPDFSSWHAKVFGKQWGLIIPPEHISYFSRITMKKILENNGFEILTLQKNYKIFTWNYIFKHTQTFFPRIYPLARILLRCLPQGFLMKYRTFFVGEMFVVARKK